MNYSQKRAARIAAVEVLRRPGSSKNAFMQRDFESKPSNKAWYRKRISPYTQIGIERLKCIRCDEKAEFQWQICSDGNNYRPICGDCDINLNEMVLKFMGHPEVNSLIEKYEQGR